MTTARTNNGSTAGEVVVVGSVNVDQVVTVGRHPLPGETLIGHGLTLLPGGKGANQAVAAAQLGATVRLIGRVGGDPQAAIATEYLTRAGVDLSAVHAVSGPTGLAIVTVADDGENSIIVIPGANAAMTDSVVADSADVISAAAVVVLQGEIPASGIEAAVRLATGRVVFNLAPVIDLAAAVILRADPLVVNEHEAALVLLQLQRTGIAPTGSEAADAAANADQPAVADPAPDADEIAVARLRALGLRSVVLTRGAAGAICADASGTCSVPAPVVTAVDSSGAGDAFVGALSARLAGGSALLEAVQFAVRVGAFAVQGRGTQPSYPTTADALPAVNA
ncbi:ribokinase [Cryobacterium frigoriphilum]|uniref:Ribokinase n=1 Tax=Cryobacterium frigoriphilum TaxID=1259150 RepID=A0A4R8ZVA7_9MICO|nr:ribokinase [Cryobacterium frigoriphilum]TFD47285.1 ribokinase [Cryobacterium frigoriphilum]